MVRRICENCLNPKCVAFFTTQSIHARYDRRQASDHCTTGMGHGGATTSMDAPASSRIFTIFPNPISAAMCRAVDLRLSKSLDDPGARCPEISQLSYTKKEKERERERKLQMSKGGNTLPGFPLFLKMDRRKTYQIGRVAALGSSRYLACPLASFSFSSSSSSSVTTTL